MRRGLTGRNRQAAKVLVVAAVLTLLVASLPQFRKVELSFYDSRMDFWQLFSSPLDARIRLVTLEDSSRELGWDDSKVLDLLNDLQAAGVSKVYIYGEGFFSDSTSRDKLPSNVTFQEPVDLNKADGLPDADGLIRSFPLNESLYLTARNLASALEKEPFTPEGDRFYIEFETNRGQEKNQQFTDSLAPLPIQDVAQTLKAPDLRGHFSGSIVMMGRLTPDSGATSVSTPAGPIFPSVLVACATNTFLDGWNLRRYGFFVSLVLTLAAMTVVAFGLSGRKPSRVALGGGLGLLSLFVGSFFLLPLEVDFRVAQLLLGVFLTITILIFAEGQRARKVLQNFGGVEDSELTGAETEATIVFTELPKYLFELEKRQDKDLLSRRRDYNTLLETIARKYHGRVLDYQGDAQMLGFGLRHEHDPDHALEGTAAALEIVATIPELAEVWKLPKDELQVHAGVCSGTVALGHVGANQKQDIAAIGDTTNTAARLMGAAMKLGLPVVAAESTFNASQGNIVGESLPPVELKGKSAPVAVYSVQTVDEEWRQSNIKKLKDFTPEGGTLSYSGESRADLRATLLFAALGFFALLFVRHFNLTTLIEDQLYDRVHSRLGMASSDPRIVIVGIDEASMEKLGPYPWPRGIYAQAIENLKESGYRGIFFDIVFKLPSQTDSEGDKALSDEFVSEPRAVTGAALVRNHDRLEDPLLFLSDERREQLRRNHQLGLIHVHTDSDQSVRKATLAARETASSEQRYYLTAALALMLEPKDQATFEPGRIVLPDQSLKVSSSQTAPNETLIRFGPPATGRQGPAEGSYRQFSFYQLLDPSDPIFESLVGSYLLVGDTSQGGERSEIDRVDTMVGSLKGIEIHARTLDMILNRTYILQASEKVEGFWLAVLAVLTVYVLVKYRRWFDYLPRLLVIVVFQGLVYLVSFTVFNYRIEFVYPLILIFGLCGFVMLGRYLLTLRALSRFVPQEVADELIFHHQARDRRLVATVLLTDIRGYTTLSEGRSAVAMLDILNEYHRRTVACYERYGGQALTYQGDAQIVVFGVFGKRASPATDAVAAALELQTICDQLCTEWGIESRDDFDVGAGLCTGEVEVGFLGGETNLQYSVVGETVRKSHKVQSLSADLEAPVILDEETFAMVQGRVVCDDLGLVQPKGLDHEIRLYRAKAVHPAPGPTPTPSTSPEVM